LGDSGAANSRFTASKTASHISLLRLQPVRGVGRKLASGLLTWRRSLEAQFIHQADPNNKVPDETLVDRELATERLKLSRSLSNSIGELKSTSRRIMTAHSALRPRVEKARSNYAQAATDLDAATRVNFVQVKKAPGYAEGRVTSKSRLA
jgi:hypothetical protein